jgi:hypothetical protein
MINPFIEHVPHIHVWRLRQAGESCGIPGSVARSDAVIWRSSCGESTTTSCTSSSVDQFQPHVMTDINFINMVVSLIDVSGSMDLVVLEAVAL